jgi:hypothetical protein
MARRPLLAGSRRAISTARAVLADPRLADRADQVDLETTDPVDPAGPHPTDRAAEADPVTTDPVDPADLQVSDQADRVVPARGMATPSAATSTEPRGATALGPGALARHRGQTGVGRFRRRVDSG